jgi:hypothetical protein
VFPEIASKRDQIQKITEKVNKKSKNFELDEIIENENKELKKDIDIFNSLTEEEKAYWVIEKHNSFVETINWTLQQDFLNGDSSFDRYLIITYIQQLANILTIYDVEFTKIMIGVLIKENCVELLAILNVLNYV